MDANEESALAYQLDAALPVVLTLPVAIGYAFASVVWVDSNGRQDVLDLQARLSSVGAHLSQFNEFELHRIYGKTQVHWIYAFGRKANAFFLWIKIQVPSFERLWLTLPAFQAEVTISFNVDDPATVALLRSLVVSRNLLLHFDDVPEWVRQLPPLSSDQRRARDYGKRGQELVRSSLPLEFRPEVIAKMGVQLEQWLKNANWCQYCKAEPGSRRNGWVGRNTPEGTKLNTGK
jgi:hypothetical protein